jgi:spore coat protein CotH
MPDDATQPTSRPAKSITDEFFSTGLIPRLRIDIAPQQMDALRKDPRAYARATVTELIPGQPDQTYPNASVHLKGMWGSFRDIGDRPAFTLSFGRLPGGQPFHGLWKLHLNNSVQDPTFLSENLGRTLFRAAGIPVPRSSHARVWLNGKDMGFYVLLEGLDRTFLQRSYNARSGIVFEGNLQEIDQPLNAVVAERSQPTTRPLKDSPEGKKLQAEAKTKALPELKKLVDAVNERDRVLRRKKLEEVLDVDRFLTFMAMEALTAHWDGYCANRNNYRIFQNPQTGKFIFMAHGMDQLFQQPDCSLFMTNGVIARVLLETPEDRYRYIERVAELRQTVFTPEALTKRLDEIATHTLPAMADINPDAARQHKDHIAEMKHRIQDRFRGVDRQLASFPRPLKFDSTGLASLKGWQLQQQSGQASFDRLTEDGKPLLRLFASTPCTASLRTTVLLPKGKYTFQARCRATQLTPANDTGGLCLRISGSQATSRLSGNTDWQTCQYEFEVPDPSREVVLVCELKAKSGQAFLDEQSLTLQKR